MYIPHRSFHQRHSIKNYVWGELKCYVRYNTEEKIFKKLKMRFFLRLHNRGFKKCVLTKLFRNVTYSQRNKLLKLESPLPNVCQPLTMQEAERRILQEGEAMFSLSKQDGASTLNAVQTQTCSMPKNTAGASFHQGISSTEGLNSLPASCSTISY